MLLREKGLSYDLPNQLKWSKFCAALRQLGYGKPKGYGGSARNFFLEYPPKKKHSLPELMTAHEPHGGDTIRPGTLRSYIRKLNMTHDEFIEVLNGAVEERVEAEPDEDLFRHTVDSDGSTISNCNRCWEMVIRSFSLEEVIAAEQAHLCPEQPA